MVSLGPIYSYYGYGDGSICLVIVRRHNPSVGLWEPLCYWCCRLACGWLGFGVVVANADVLMLMWMIFMLMLEKLVLMMCKLMLILILMLIRLLLKLTLVVMWLT